MKNLSLKEFTKLHNILSEADKKYLHKIWKNKAKVAKYLKLIEEREKIEQSYELMNIAFLSSEADMTKIFHYCK